MLTISDGLFFEVSHYWSLQSPLFIYSLPGLFPFQKKNCCLFLVSRMRKRPVLSIKYFGLSNVQFGDKVSLFVLFKKILGKYIGEYLANFWEYVLIKCQWKVHWLLKNPGLTEDKEQSDE